ncbi:MarR family winged helix-turn-helix transcriptional regulator [Denitromonas iodatirespirans]|uniref:MarR family transcriptional regulator n=1 Tax=Denitromonas iodatirespirans TaxID=2795389 RepID=A0A944D5W2_DENI1|nr:MarR family transcriptional regulator [Denitromonas iodatirespirans]MBT0960440.1 MarR family transcriptional regulator [Denitromonas iodatirespirans]
MNGPTHGDAVDTILAQWRRERPDLDLAPMSMIGRLARCASLMRRELDTVFSAFGIGRGEFDVLATLRRAGAPYALTPTALFSSLMITSGTMTHRLQGLEARGWIERQPDPKDARSKLVTLTADGLALIDRAVEAHLENERRILAPLAAADVAALDARLAQLLAVLEPR